MKRRDFNMELTTLENNMFKLSNYREMIDYKLIDLMKEFGEKK